MVFTQVSQDVPNNTDNAPLDLSSTADVIIYIVLPLICVFLYFLWRRYKKKE